MILRLPSALRFNVYRSAAGVMCTDFQDASTHPYTSSAADTRPYSTTDLYTQYPPYQPVTTETHANLSVTDPRK